MEINKNTKTKKILKNIGFMAYYLIISSTIFMFLLVFSNIKAYSTIAYAYFNQDELIADKANIENSIANSIIEKEGEKSNPYKIEILKEELKNSLKRETEDFLSIESLINKEAQINLDVEIVPYENRIIIPKIGKSVPLVDVYSVEDDTNLLNNIFMDELAKGVVRYPGTAKPGEDGNSFIFGHSSNFPWVKGEYNEIFALLNNLESGDEVIVYYNQKKYVYIITEKHVVKPGDTELLDSRDKTKKELSLMTCWPIGTNINRLIVISELQD